MQMILKNFFIRFIRLFPNFLWPLKRIIIKITLAEPEHGKNVKISSESIIVRPDLLYLGNDVFISSGFYCAVIKKCTIGNRIMFGANCSILGGDHNYSGPTENMRFNKKLGDNREIVIEDDTWIGHGSVLLKKSFIGEGTIVGANSVVNAKLLPYSVYVGHPAKFINPDLKNIQILKNI